MTEIKNQEINNNSRNEGDVYSDIVLWLEESRKKINDILK